MSEPGKQAPSEFTELWKTVVSKLCHSKTPDKDTGKQMPGTSVSPMCKDFQSPRRRDCKYPGLNTGDSPGDGEASHDIFWDPTSPTQPNAGSGLRNTKVVEISDIVNRIAPKDVDRKRTESPLLQWICDSAIPCTPEIPKPRVRKKSSRQSSVEDLMKLARQFDENMQQDKETSEQLNIINNNLINTSEKELLQASISSNVKDPGCPSSADKVEAELHALFDCSTQGVSGRLSQGSAASASSQQTKDQTVTLDLTEHQRPDLKSAEKSVSAVHPAEEKESGGYGGKSCDDFDDDWENDDLLNDSFVLAMTQVSDEKHNTNPKTNNKQLTPICKPTANTNSACQALNVHCKPSSSELQELCPKPKTTNRSTFKLEPNPHFQPKMARDVSKLSSTVAQPKSHIFDQKSATTKTPSTPQADKVTIDHCGNIIGTDSVKDISDSLWDDEGDDALLYQACDSIETIANSQTQKGSPSNCQVKLDIAADGQRKTTKSLPINTAWSMNAGASANRLSPCAFVRSNSLPGTSCETVNYQGWNIPMKSANIKSGMSQSFPGRHTSLGAINQCRDSSGNFHGGNANVEKKPHTVTARAPQNSKSGHTAFKRNVSDSAIIGNKVFVTSQMTGKCSGAEIERKKQEALARRRLRMQNVPKQ
ncbi:ewing's tumor-associated antigen 1 [Mugil cephalus]|uniref:ewing's tumor-associated antigen 1 n=1 Tax=Mugil cephalus TaxID=48193 RepID=UPI001FB73AC6|nr:ewing's tumor-associated antigen 1 [Mugil cephalus]